MPKNESPFRRASAKRSPFPRRSLPQAGESSYVAALDIFVERFFIYAATGLTIAAVAMIEWMSSWLGRPISPWTWTLFAIGILLLAAWRWFRIRPQLAALRLGIRGEREVGRMLERLRADGYIVYHDIPGKGDSNIDHALIGPGGVFAIETKAISKRPGKDAHIDYDGSRILIDGLAPDRDPIAQAQMNADFLHDLLLQITTRDEFVRPVVLFPGWFINGKSSGRRTWVHNMDTFFAFIENEREKLTPQDIAMLTSQLEIHLSNRA